MKPLDRATIQVVRTDDGATKLILNGVDISKQVTDLNIRMNGREAVVEMVFLNPIIDTLVDELREVGRVGLDEHTTEVRLVRTVGSSRR